MIFNTKIQWSGILVLTILISTIPVFADTSEQQVQNFDNIPNNIVYEGRLLSSTGERLQGEYVARFSFWSNSDYTENTILNSGLINVSDEGFSGWQEVIPLEFNELGHFSVVLGNTQNFSTLHFSNFKYLQVEIKKASEPDTAYELIDIDGDNGADTNDRKLIASVPYSIYSYGSQYSKNSEFSQGSQNNLFILSSIDGQ